MTPSQQIQQRQHNEGNDASTKKVTIPVQLTMPAQQELAPGDESRRQRDEGNNADKVLGATMECGYNYLRLLLYDN